MIFEILSLDLDGSWMTLDASAPLTRYFDCVGEGRRTEIWDFWPFWPFWLWDFEISEIWLKFSIVTFGCEELSREGSAKGPEDEFSGFLPFWAIFDIFDWWFVTFWIKFWSYLAILVDFGSVRGPGGSRRWRIGPAKQLRAWSGSGRGQGPRSGEGSGRFAAILNLGVKIWGLRSISGHFGHFGPFLGPGPCPNPDRSRAPDRNFPKSLSYGWGTLLTLHGLFRTRPKSCFGIFG